MCSTNMPHKCAPCPTNVSRSPSRRSLPRCVYKKGGLNCKCFPLVPTMCTTNVPHQYAPQMCPMPHKCAPHAALPHQCAPQMFLSKSGLKLWSVSRSPVSQQEPHKCAPHAALPHQEIVWRVSGGEVAALVCIQKGWP